MDAYYLDTSALVKLYVQEPGTERMLQIAERHRTPGLVVLAIARVEFRAAVRRRQRNGDLAPGDAQFAMRHFEEHWRDLYVVQPLTDAVLMDAVGLVDRHALRAYDAVQLAGCIAVRTSFSQEGLVLVSSDRALLEAASGEGFEVLDPTNGGDGAQL